MQKLEELKYLLEEYKKHNPEAENPMDNIATIGFDRLIKILKEAKTRKITFKYINKRGLLDNIEYKIED